MIYYLVDNGSLRADSWRNLQAVAAALGQRTGTDVRPASLLHSAAIPPAELDGERAWTLEPALRDALAAGERAFGIIPFFFGPSRAITRFLPERLDALRGEFPGAQFHLARWLCDTEREASTTLASILADRVRTTIREQVLDRPPVVLVDHGSPAPAVTRVRDYLAGQLSVLLQGEVRCVGPASMERREGAIYKFNEPLLANRLDAAPYDSGSVVVCLLFLSPGRHAGPGGDIADICTAARTRHPDLRTHMTEPIGSHPDLLKLLEQRLATVAT